MLRFALHELLTPSIWLYYSNNEGNAYLKLSTQSCLSSIPVSDALLHRFSTTDRSGSSDYGSSESHEFSLPGVARSQRPVWVLVTAVLELNTSVCAILREEVARQVSAHRAMTKDVIM
jgi:hypothetical protein